MSNESLPTRFIHFLPNSLAVTSDATVTQLSSADFLNSTSSANFDTKVNSLTNQTRPKTRRAPISTSSVETSEEPNRYEVDSEESLRAQLLANFEDVRAQLAKLTTQTKEMSENFNYERQQLLETIDELGDQVKFLKRETQIQKDSYRESLQEIENKSDELATQLTNTLIENACLREENAQLREEQVNLTDRVRGLERKLNHLDLDQPRVKKILKSLERREEGLKLQIKRLAQLEASQRETPFCTTSRSRSSVFLDYNDEDYKRVTEKARAILRREKIVYSKPVQSQTPTKKSEAQQKHPGQVPLSTSNASTSTQCGPGPDPREEEEEVLRSLFFPF